MTPQIIKQTKVLLANENNAPATNFSRLQANTMNIPNAGAELEDWTDDDQPAGWEELDDEHTKNLIREKRREQRLQRQQQQKQKQSRVSHHGGGHHIFAEKLGTNKQS